MTALIDPLSDDPLADGEGDTDLDASMEKLARQMAGDAMLATTSPETRVDIFKALTTYYLGSKKRKPPEPPKNGLGFGAMRDRINQAGGTTGHG